jgi:cbb3-type cytochrome oxidase maturation protein
MDILYLLIPLSAVLVLGILGVFGWALYRGQFEELEHEGERILDADPTPVDDDQVPQRSATEQSPPTSNRLS